MALGTYSPGPFADWIAIDFPQVAPAFGDCYSQSSTRQAVNFTAELLRSAPKVSTTDPDGSDGLIVHYDPVGSQVTPVGAIPAPAVLGGAISLDAFVNEGPHLVSRVMAERVAAVDRALAAKKGYRFTTLLHEIAHRPGLYNDLVSCTNQLSVYNSLSADIWIDALEALITQPIGTANGYLVFDGGSLTVTTPAPPNGRPISSPGPTINVNAGIYVLPSTLRAIDWEADSTIAVNIVGAVDASTHDFTLPNSAGEIRYTFNANTPPTDPSFDWTSYTNTAGASAAFATHANNSARYCFVGEIVSQNPPTLIEQYFPEVFAEETQAWLGELSNPDGYPTLAECEAALPALVDFWDDFFTITDTRCRQGTSSADPGPWDITGKIIVEYVYFPTSTPWTALKEIYTDNRVLQVVGTPQAPETVADTFEGRYARGYGPDNQILVAYWEETRVVVDDTGVDESITYAERFLNVGRLSYDGSTVSITAEATLIFTVTHTATRDTGPPQTETWSTQALANWGADFYGQNTQYSSTRMSINAASDTTPWSQSFVSDWITNEYIPASAGGTDRQVDGDRIWAAPINDQIFKTALIDRDNDNVPEVLVTDVDGTDYEGYDLEATVDLLPQNLKDTDAAYSEVPVLVSGSWQVLRDFGGAGDHRITGSVTTKWIAGFNPFLASQIGGISYYPGPIRGDEVPGTASTGFWIPLWNRQDGGGNPISWDTIRPVPTNVGGRLSVGEYPPFIPVDGCTIMAPTLKSGDDGVCIIRRTAGYAAAKSSHLAVIADPNSTPQQISDSFDALEAEITVVFNNFASKELYVALSDQTYVTVYPSPEAA